MSTEIYNHIRGENKKISKTVYDSNNSIIIGIESPFDEYEALCERMTLVPKIKTIFSILDEKKKKLFILKSESYEDREIAAIMGYTSTEAVSSKTSKVRKRIRLHFGIESANRKVDYDKIRQLYEQGLYDKDIAFRVKCGKSVIWKWRKENGLRANGENEGSRARWLVKRLT